ncbi:MAG: phosphoglycerate mutase family protein [Rufibacter sp.]
MRAQSRAQIFLIRHAKPIINNRGWFSKSEAQQYLQEYQVAEVEEILEQTLPLGPETVKKVLCSSLPRAKMTARMLFGAEVALEENALFLEFENRISGFGLVKLPLSWWTFFSRVLWLLGLNQHGIESFKAAKTRANKVTELLVQEARKEGIAVLVAHGFLNNFIKRALKKRGWNLVLNGGHSFAGVTLVEKPFPF